jgi:SAM-dependent methyltransferase
MTEEIDFDALYRGKPIVPGGEYTGVPWDIGSAQPNVVALEREGRFTGDVLDIGCGLGGNALHLARLGHRVTGLDASPAAIKQAIERAGDVPVTFAVADATTLTGYSSAFDSVLDSALFHCLSPAEQRLYASALHRATRPGARLSLLCFRAPTPGELPTPLPVPEEDLRTALTDAGWTITSLERGSLSSLRSAMGDNSAGASPFAQLPIWIVLADRRE